MINWYNRLPGIARFIINLLFFSVLVQLSWNHFLPRLLPELVNRGYIQVPINTWEAFGVSLMRYLILGMRRSVPDQNHEERDSEPDDMPVELKETLFNAALFAAISDKMKEYEEDDEEEKD